MWDHFVWHFWVTDGQGGHVRANQSEGLFPQIPRIEQGRPVQTPHGSALLIESLILLPPAKSQTREGFTIQFAILTPYFEVQSCVSANHCYH